MNSQSLVPGYLVTYTDRSGNTKRKTFFDSNLLTARQNALRHAQELQVKPLRTFMLDISIHLTGTDRTVFGSKPEIICTIFKQQFQPNLVIHPKKPLRISMDVNPDLIQGELPSDLNLTIDVTKEDESFNSPLSVWDSLGEMTCEYEYYVAHGSHTGFSAVTLEIQMPLAPMPEFKDLSSLSDEEIEARLVILKKPRPYSTFFLLYDSLSYVASLIGSYNQQYAHKSGSLSFTTTFLP